MPLYNLVVLLYGLLIRLASGRKKKAREWVEGRKDWRRRYADSIALLGSGKKIWVHCASYGEFEQGRPLIEAMRKSKPEYRIILSFFSPSGYEAFKNWPGADYICYLPLDTRRNAQDFIRLLKPSAVIFIKYEFWLNFLRELKKQSIPTYLVSAVFKPRHAFFKWYGGIFRHSLQTFNKMFVQDAASGSLLDSIGNSNYEITGDTRFDRVRQIRNHFAPIPYFESYCAGKQVIVAGSTWPKDEALLLEAFVAAKTKDLRLIIAPHEVDEANIQRLGELLDSRKINWIRFTKADGMQDANVLVIDTIGMLSRLYHYAAVAYIGGGFNEGLHNTLEPAVYGIPVTFYGKDHAAFNEVGEMMALGAAHGVNDAAELTGLIETFLQDASGQKLIRDNLRMYFEKNSNVAEKVLDRMKL